jgi:hypothetical protein
MVDQRIKCREALMTIVKMFGWPANIDINPNVRKAD